MRNSKPKLSPETQAYIDARWTAHREQSPAFTDKEVEAAAYLDALDKVFIEYQATLARQADPVRVVAITISAIESIHEVLVSSNR
jgi:hypothetical protein